MTISFLVYAEGRSQKATLVVILLVVVISSLKIRSGVQRNFAHIFVLAFPTDLPPQIFSWHNAIISVIKVRFMLQYQFKTWHWTFINTTAACCSTMCGASLRLLQHSGAQSWIFMQRRVHSTFHTCYKQMPLPAPNQHCQTNEVKQ